MVAGIGAYYTHAPLVVAVDHKFTEQHSMLVHSDKVHLSLTSIAQVKTKIYLQA